MGLYRLSQHSARWKTSRSTCKMSFGRTRMRWQICLRLGERSIFVGVQRDWERVLPRFARRFIERGLVLGRRKRMSGWRDKRRIVMLVMFLVENPEEKMRLVSHLTFLSLSLVRIQTFSFVSSHVSSMATFSLTTKFTTNTSRTSSCELITRQKGGAIKQDAFNFLYNISKMVFILKKRLNFQSIPFKLGFDTRIANRYNSILSKQYNII
jgi:hypothetical protein